MRRRRLSSNSNKEFISPTIATAIYIDEANPMPRNWEKEEKMKKIILLGVIAVMLLLTASTAMADTIVWQIGVFDYLYGVTDGTKITTPPDRSTASTGTVTVDYTDVSKFYSVLLRGTTITGIFTADLSKGAVLLISWSPGASAAEKFSVTLDETTMSSRIVDGYICTSDPTDGRCGQVPSYYSNYTGLPYYTEIFDFGLVGSGTEIHTLSINYSQGDGIGFDYLELSTPALSECVPPPLDMVSWWPGDGDAVDIVGNNDGTVNDATYVSGKVGNAFSFDGVDDYISLGTTQIIGDDASFTIDAWINVNSYATHNKQLPIYGEYNLGTSDAKNYLAIGNTQSGLGQRVFFDQFVPTGGYLKSNIQLTPGRWYHVAYTQDGTTRRLYIDGTLDNSDSEIETYLGGIPNDIRIGRRGGTATNQRFDGLIDEVEIFNRALSFAEIRAIYLAGSAGKCKVIEVKINIKPGSDPNSINLCSGGATPVIIFGSENFDVTTIDPNQLSLGTASVKTVGKSGRYLCSIEDVGAPDDGFFDSFNPNPDGHDDMICHFVTTDMDAEDTSETATVLIIGCDNPSGGCAEEDPGYYMIIATDSVKIVKDCDKP